MLKHLTLAALASVSLAVASLPAHAALSATDCAYYQQQFNQGAGGTGPGSPNFYEQQLQHCR